MRDDIHKTAPVSPAWRRVLRSAVNAAERGETLVYYTRVAAIESLKQSVSPGFLARFSERCDGNSSLFFGPEEARVAVHSLEHEARTPAEQRILQNAELATQDGYFGARLCSVAIAQELTEVVANSQEELSAHLRRSNGGKLDRETHLALKNVQQQLEPFTLLGPTGVPKQKKEIQKPILNLDENLLGETRR